MTDIETELIQLIQSGISQTTLKKMFSLAVDDRGELSKFFTDKCTLKGIDGNCVEQLILKLKSEGELQYVLDVWEKDDLVNVTALIKGKNIYNILSPIDISESTKRFIASITPPKNGIAKGVFEIISLAFLKDVNTSNLFYGTRHGDIHAGGLALEYKGPLARICGTVAHPVYQEVTKLKEILIDEYVWPADYYIDDIYAGKKTSEQYFKSIVADLCGIKMTNEELFDIILRSMIASHTNWLKYDKDIRSFSDDYDFLCKEVVKDASKGIVDGNALTRLRLAINFKGYAEDDNWDYLIGFKGKNGEDAIQNGDYIVISNDNARNLRYIYEHPNISYRGRGGSLEGRSQYVQVIFT